MVSRYHATPGPPGSQAPGSSGAPGKEHLQHMHHHHHPHPHSHPHAHPAHAHPHHCLVAHCPPGQQQSPQAAAAVASQHQQHQQASAAAMTQFRLLAAAAAAGRADVHFHPIVTNSAGGAQGYVAQPSAHGHPSQHSAHPQAPPHAQGSVSGSGAAGHMRSTMHHPGQGGPQQSGPPPPQNPTPTSTPPGAPQPHSEMGKQGPPHMQGQPQMQGNAHGQLQMAYNLNPRAPHQQYVQRQNTNPRMPNHRSMATNSMGQQIFTQVPQMHPVFSSNIVPSTPATLYSPVQLPYQGRPASTTQWSQFPNQGHHVPMYSIQYPYHQQASGQYFLQGQPTIPMMRPGVIGQQQSAPHAAAQAPHQTQAPSSGGPPQGPQTQEKQQRRRPNAIAIVHPETGKDLLDEICSEGSNSTAATPPRSGESSARETPQPNSSENHIAAEFAAKVAIAAGEDSVGHPPGGASGLCNSDYPQADSRTGPPVNGPSPHSRVDNCESMDSGPSVKTHPTPVVNKAVPEGHPVKTNPGEDWNISKSLATPSTQQGVAPPSDKKLVSQPLMGYATVAKVASSSTPLSESGAKKDAEEITLIKETKTDSSTIVEPSVVVAPATKTVKPKEEQAARQLVPPIVTPPTVEVVSTPSPVPAPPIFQQTVRAAAAPQATAASSSSPQSLTPALTPTAPVPVTPVPPVASVDAAPPLSAPVPVSLPQRPKREQQQAAATAAMPVVAPPQPVPQQPPPAPTPAAAPATTTIAAALVQMSPVISAPMAQVQDAPRQQPSPVPSSEHANGEIGVDQEAKAPQRRQAKGRNKQQAREMMNKRGAEKEGTDMDAFVETQQAPVKEETNAPAPPNSKPPSPAPAVPTSAPQPTEVVAELVEPVVKKSPTDQEAIPNSQPNNGEEDLAEKMVAARNEGNARASAEAASNSQSTTSLNPTTTAVIEKLQDAGPKLIYKQDQWSPQNQEGKKKYERDFLLQLQTDPQSMKRPDNLPKLEVVINDSFKARGTDTRLLNTLNRGGSNTENILMPKFMSQNTPRGSLMKRNSQQGKPKTPKVIQLNLSLNEEVKLNESDNAWRPGRMQPSKLEETTQLEPHEELYKKVRSVLNKLTPQKFELLVDQVKTLPIDSKEKLEGVINLVFLKAVDEPNFSVAYAMMCQTLSTMQVSVERNKDGKTSMEMINFKKMLLGRCQEEFEKPRDVKDEQRREERLKEIEAAEGEKKKELEAQFEDEERRIRTKYVGVNRFIGELFKRNMLTSGIMMQCISKLLEASDEEALECVCKLLTTIGKELEAPRQENKQGGRPDNKQVSRSDKQPQDLSQHFNRMQKIVNERNTSSRIRFMLQDVIELRADNWRPRRGDSNPKTMDEIAKEAERETMNQLSAPPSHSTRGKDDRDRGDRDRKRGRSGVTDDGWNVAGGGGRFTTPRGPLEINKLKVKSDMDTLNLGSKSQFTSWSKGSGGHKPKAEDIRGGNPFSVLSQDEKNAPGMIPAKDMANLATRSSSEIKKVTTGDVRPSSRPSSRDSSVMRDTSTTLKSGGIPINPKGAVKLPQEELEARAKLLIDEYLSNGNIEDLIICIKEEVHPTQLSGMLSRWLMLTLEWSASKRSKTTNAIVMLHKENIVNDTHMLPALEMVIEMADDLLIDIPMTYSYLAEVIVPVMLIESLTFSQIRDAMNPIKGTRGARKLMLEIVELLQLEGGPGWIVSHWVASSMNWSDFVPEDEVESFLAQNNLLYFVDENALEVSVNSSKQPMPVDEFHSRLLKMLNSSSYEDINKWITCNVGDSIKTAKYIRALMTSVCESAIHEDKNLMDEKFVQNCKLIHRWVDREETLELQALYAVQVLVTRLMHPSNLLFKILENLMENNIFSRDSIQAWVKSEDPAEREGRGVAMKSITQFITWLNEPEDYDSTDETS